MKLILLGPPGVGKGTHGEKIAAKYSIPKISMGDLLREEVAKKTEIGLRAKSIMDKGILIPDEVTLRILAKRLAKKDCKNGFILDGFPRTINQAEKLAAIETVDVALNLSAPKDVITERLTGRWTCKKCAEIYHVKFSPPKKQGACDKCGGELYQRDDQKTEAINVRLEVYENQTKPLIDYYEKKGILFHVDVQGEILEVSARIMDALGKALCSVKERTLVVMKPDSVKMGLAGEIIKRYQEAGLRLVGLKMLNVSRALIKQHYPEDEEYVISLGKKSEKAGDVIKDYKAQGMMIINGLRSFLTSGPVIAMVFQGNDAIQKVRKITGYTDPVSAGKGTIRGDHIHDSIQEANKEKRAVQNLIHASGNPEEAAREIILWFKPKELVE